MRGLRPTVLILTFAASVGATAGNLTRDSAIGGALGGALGGAVGAELGGREGAIVGAGVGAAAGTALNTQDYQSPPSRHEVYRYDGHSHGTPYGNGGFCPPGQAKKGRC